MEFGIFILAIITIGLLFYIISKLLPSNKENIYRLLHFQGDRLRIGFGPFSSTYRLDEIAEVRFYTCPRRGRLIFAGYQGNLRVVKRDGHWCRWISFDASPYYKQIVWSSSERGIEMTTDLLIEELEGHGIHCTRE